MAEMTNSTTTTSYVQIIAAGATKFLFQCFESSVEINFGSSTPSGRGIIIAPDTDPRTIPVPESTDKVYARAPSESPSSSLTRMSYTALSQ